jgi:hypothetical protein
LRPGVCLGGARIRVPSVGKPGHTPGNVKLLLPPRQSRGNSQCIRIGDATRLIRAIKAVTLSFDTDFQKTSPDAAFTQRSTRANSPSMRGQ